MKKYLLFSVFFALLIGFYGCSSEKRQVSIIDEEKFIQVLTDIHMADATLVVKGFRINADSVRVRKYYNDVLMDNNVTQKQIHDTFIYYTKNPRDFEKVYEKVSANIVKLEKEYQEKTKERKEKMRKEGSEVNDKEEKS